MRIIANKRGMAHVSLASIHLRAKHLLHLRGTVGFQMSCSQNPLTLCIYMYISVCLCFRLISADSNGYTYHINLCFAITQGEGRCAATQMSAVSWCLCLSCSWMYGAYMHVHVLYASICVWFLLVYLYGCLVAIELRLSAGISQRVSRKFN